MNTAVIKEELAKTIRNYNAKGWSPATSTNYSFKDESGQIWVSRSGVDKSVFSSGDFITVNENGHPTGEYVHVKPSAETLIHCVIYRLFPTTQVILHSHGVFPVLLSADKNELHFEGYEIQKGFEGEKTHLNTVKIPVFENTQDMDEFAKAMQMDADKIKQHCLVIRKHGTYAWGNSLFEAKRHLETLDYLCECEWRK